ncbi:hypothetical protein GF351_06295 [Candidatus Woesearchaeota archaeon]|nr:hypothetical protein [Candidatus Woesearchaeota archaeon]
MEEDIEQQETVYEEEMNDDELSPEEEGFIRGYEEATEDDDKTDEVEC